MKLPPKVINSNVLYQHHTLDIPFDILKSTIPKTIFFKVYLMQYADNRKGSLSHLIHCSE